MYALLHYRGDASALAEPVTVTRSDGGRERTVPRLLGLDADPPAGRPYEVIDVDVERVDAGTFANPDATEAVRSTVHLAIASPETLRGHRSRAYHDHEADQARRQAHARVAHFWRPDLWPAPPAPALEETRTA